MPEKVKLGDLELTATQVLRLSLTATIPRHKTEKQFSVADHIVHEPEAVKITCKLIKDTDEYESLLKLYTQRQPFEFSSELYTISEAVIESIEIEPAGLNTYNAEITIKAIKRAELKTRIITFRDPADPNIIHETGEEPKGSDTPQSPKPSEEAKEVEEQEGQNWAEKIINWLGKKLGGIF